MYFALGAAASTAADLLQSLVPGKSSTSKATTGLTQNTTTPFDVSSTTITPSNALPSSGSTSQSGALAPQTLSALFAASQSSSSSATSQSDALKDLFGQLDVNGDGQISKSEFESKLGAGGTNVANADSVFGKLDTNGDGSVSLDELTKALTATKRGGGGHHHAHGAGGGGKSGQDALLQALDGASGTSSTNSDGSTSTTVTYADGSTVTMTTPAASKSSTSSSASSTYNLVEQMIQKQATALATSAQQSLSVSV